MSRFPANSRVCFLGDSITHGNNYVLRIFSHYKKYFPEDHVKIWNCGVSGGSARSADLYLEDDLLRHDPTHVVIMIGINDSGRDLLRNEHTPELFAQLDAIRAGYAENVRHICDRLEEKNIKIILCTPSPYAEFTPYPDALPGGHKLILQYAETVRAFAEERGYPVVDYHARLSELYLDEEIYNPDHVHPNDLGHYRMAEAFLHAQGLKIDPYQPLSNVSEDAGLDEWADLVGRLRNIFAAEWMIVCNYGLSYEEKMKCVEEYIREKKWGDFEYFKWLSASYAENKPKEKEIAARIDEITENI